MGKNWAIAIGINHYDNLQPLQYAQRDAAALRNFCLQDLGFEQVYYFSDDSPPIATNQGPPLKSQPTFGTLSRFLRVRFEQPWLQSGDNLWFFFAGHGKRHRDRDYLMPIDADPGNLEATALSIADITERLRRCGADNVILMLDACRNEGDRSGEGIGLDTQKGVVTLFSCSPSERSYEIDELQQGAFTHALLQGLRIQGEGNCATVERLDHFLRVQVPEVNRRYGKPRQIPYSTVEPSAKYHLILLPKFATLADVMTLKNDALEAEAERHWELAEQLWTRVLAVSPADPQAIKAIKRIALGVAQAPGMAPETPSPPSSVPTGQRTAAVPSPAKPPIPTFEFESATLELKQTKGFAGFGQKVELMTHRHPGQVEYRTESLGNAPSLVLVAVPGGRFVMGSPPNEEGRDWYQNFDPDLKDPEGPQHSVQVQAFWMGKYPVTQAQWRWVANLSKVNCDLNPEPSQFKGDSRPVEQVSWWEAVEFCDRLSRETGRDYRLPSEAEWEYSCRAGTRTPFYFGETITTDLANYAGLDWEYQGKTYPGSYGAGPKGIYRQETTDVGLFPPNAFGLYDMHGNVWEWCLDHWHDNYQGAPSDQKPWLTNNDKAFRLLRGGSWYDSPRNCRSAYRGRYGPDLRDYAVGFRVVCASAWTL